MRNKTNQKENKFFYVNLSLILTLTFIFTLAFLFTSSKLAFAACKLLDSTSVEMRLTYSTYRKARFNTKSVKFGQGDYIIMTFPNAKERAYLTQGYYMEDGAGNFKVKASGFLHHEHEMGKLRQNPTHHIYFDFDHEVSSTEGLSDGKSLSQRISEPCDLEDLFPRINDYFEYDMYKYSW